MPTEKRQRPNSKRRTLKTSADSSVFFKVLKFFVSFLAIVNPRALANVVEGLTVNSNFSLVNSSNSDSETNNFVTNPYTPPLPEEPENTSQLPKQERKLNKSKKAKAEATSSIAELNFLHAVDSEDKDKIRLLLNRGMDPQKAGPDGRTPLNVALEKKWKNSDNQRAVINWMATQRLLFAIEAEDKKEIEQLLALGIDPNQPGPDGRVPSTVLERKKWRDFTAQHSVVEWMSTQNLLFAIEDENKDEVMRLTSLVNPTFASPDGRIPFLTVAEKKWKNVADQHLIIDWMVTHIGHLSPDIFRDPVGRDALTRVIQNCDPEIILYLYSHRAIANIGVLKESSQTDITWIHVHAYMGFEWVILHLQQGKYSARLIYEEIATLKKDGIFDLPDIAIYRGFLFEALEKIENTKKSENFSYSSELIPLIIPLVIEKISQLDDVAKNHVAFRILVGMANVALGKLSEAEVIYRLTFKDNPNHGQLCSLLAQVTYLQGNIPEALKLYKETAKLQLWSAEVRAIVQNMEILLPGPPTTRFFTFDNLSTIFIGLVSIVLLIILGRGLNQRRKPQPRLAPNAEDIQLGPAKAGRNPRKPRQISPPQGVTSSPAEQKPVEPPPPKKKEKAIPDTVSKGPTKEFLQGKLFSHYLKMLQTEKDINDAVERQEADLETWKLWVLALDPHKSDTKYAKLIEKVNEAKNGTEESITKIKNLSRQKNFDALTRELANINLVFNIGKAKNYEQRISILATEIEATPQEIANINSEYIRLRNKANTAGKWCAESFDKYCEEPLKNQSNPGKPGLDQLNQSLPNSASTPGTSSNPAPAVPASSSSLPNRSASPAAVGFFATPSSPSNSNTSNAEEDQDLLPVFPPVPVRTNNKPSDDPEVARLLNIIEENYSLFLNFVEIEAEKSSALNINTRARLRYMIRASELVLQYITKLGAEEQEWVNPSSLRTLRSIYKHVGMNLLINSQDEKVAQSLIGPREREPALYFKFLVEELKLGNTPQNRKDFSLGSVNKEYGKEAESANKLKSDQFKLASVLSGLQKELVKLRSCLASLQHNEDYAANRSSAIMSLALIGRETKRIFLNNTDIPVFYSYSDKTLAAIKNLEGLSSYLKEKFAADHGISMEIKGSHKPNEQRPRPLLNLLIGITKDLAKENESNTEKERKEIEVARALQTSILQGLLPTEVLLLCWEALNAMGHADADEFDKDDKLLMAIINEVLIKINSFCAEAKTIVTALDSICEHPRDASELDKLNGSEVLSFVEKWAPKNLPNMNSRGALSKKLDAFPLLKVLMESSNKKEILDQLSDQHRIILCDEISRARNQKIFVVGAEVAELLGDIADQVNPSNLSKCTLK